MQNQLFELARKRRSVRRYAGDHIADDVITEIMKVALTAPCSFGHHPVEFVVVRDKDMIEKIAACKKLGEHKLTVPMRLLLYLLKLKMKNSANSGSKTEPWHLLICCWQSSNMI